MSEDAASATLETHYRGCPFCEANCGIKLQVDPVANEIRGIRGDELDPFSKGYVCPKSFSLIELHSDPDRLRRPLVRRGSDFEEVDWETALNEAAERITSLQAKHGRESLACYMGNPSAHNTALNVALPHFLRTLGTRQLYSAGSVDANPKFMSTVTMFGGLTAMPIPDIDRTSFIILIGANPLVSNGSIMIAPGFSDRLKDLKRRNGKIVVIDPRKSETAGIADEHLAVRPGSDALLLLAMTNVLISENLVNLGRAEGLVKNLDELARLCSEYSPESVELATGVDAPTIRRIAREFAGAERACLYGRTGTNTQRFGSIANWLIDALNVLSGNLDRPGGVMFSPGVYPPVFYGEKYDGDVLPYGRWHSRVRGLPELTGLLPIAAFADEVLTPGPGRVRGLVTICGNLLLSNPNGRRLEAAVRDLELMISCDIYVNETSRFADIILPSPSYATQSDFVTTMARCYVRNFAKWTPAVLPLEDGELSDWEVFRGLTARLRGLTDEQMEEAIVDERLSSCLSVGDADVRSVPIETARAALGNEPGPDRIFDIFLRTGPFGDAFGKRPDGLNRQALLDHPHGLDLGPMTEQLPDIIATPDGMIDLAPKLITDDLARLNAAKSEFEDPEIVFLIGRREIRSKNSWMHNLRVLVKGKPRCTARINPQDAERFGIVEGGLVRVASQISSIVVPAEISSEMMVGVVSIPHGYGHDEEQNRMEIARERPGVNANLLIDDSVIDWPSIGAVLNGVPVRISPAPPA